MSQPRNTIQSRLENLGFRPVGCNSAARGALQVHFCPDWCTLTRKPSSEDGSPPAGLWKRVRTNRSQAVAFDLPASLVDGNDLDESEFDPLPALLKWAESTQHPQGMDHWEPPCREDVQNWLGKDALTVQDGPHIVQGTLIHAPHRLAIRFPVIRLSQSALSAPRRAWVARVLDDAQNRWRMVRAGIDSATEEAAVEIDLSGAPHQSLSELIQVSRDALRWVVKWTVWPITFLSDPGVQCAAWEVFRPHSEGELP